MIPVVRPRRGLCYRPNGYTLAEILIVCAIVSSLAALSFSVFSRVRSGARRSACISNLKQIGAASELYAADNNGRYPNGPQFTNPQCAWADRLLRYIRDPNIFECPASVGCAYVPGCPADEGVEHLNEFRFPISYDGSYDMNCLIRNRFVSTASFKHPDTTVFVLDGSGNIIQPGYKTWTDLESFQYSGIKPPRHNGGHNVLFLDGHVKWAAQEALMDRSLYYLGSRPPV